MMPGETGETEQRAARRMVRFGDRPTEVIHPDVAEQILIALKRTNPRLFGRLLQAAMVPDSVRQRGQGESEGGR